ncbi:MAG: NADH-quinone oxidoreductase subunit L [Fibrobacterota bacterium]|nr:NADH-quinone oxidoreductase subunit L [Fibrobacterota bacterium]
MNPALLLLIPAIPAVSALLLALFAGRLPYNAIGGLASAAVAGSLAIVLTFCGTGVFGSGQPVDFDTGPWIATQAFQAGLHLRLDSLSLCMCLLVTFFGFLITVYSIGYMRHDKEQGRFFASLNLFVASMLTLVLADNLVLIFLGWEGVGLCSYLLIGHYWQQEEVPLAAFRAFFVNRIGDVFFLLGVFSIFSLFGTVSLSELAQHGPGLASIHSGKAAMAAFFLLGGAFAKSAQAPLHVWLADAMAGPTPVSALIHAATMVTAGIYLLARLDWLYAVSPEARLLVAICALVTLVLGAVLALVQTDIKKILAYSTLSNLALMFLALAAGSTGAGLLHLFGHAFFKALLFLAAGSVIIAAHHEQDVRNLKGVLKKLPITNIAFLIGCIGGAGLLPFLAAGFFSKEAVLGALERAEFHGFGFTLPGHVVHWIVIAVETLSVLYLFRLYGYLRSDAVGPAIPKPVQAFASNAGDHAPSHGGHHGVIKETSPAILFVLGILTLAAPIFGWFSASPSFGGKGLVWSAITGGAAEPEGPHLDHVLPFLIVNLVLAVVCFVVFSRGKLRESLLARLKPLRLGAYGPLSRLFYFDDLYAVAVVAPLKGAAYLSRLVLENIFTGIITLAGWLGQGFSLALRRLQTGKAHQYAIAVLMAVFILAFYLGGN